MRNNIRAIIPNSTSHRTLFLLFYLNIFFIRVSLVASVVKVKLVLWLDSPGFPS